jgi:hypothetical protein
MDFLTVVSRLNDLPSTFKREGNPYAQIVDSLADGANRFTQAADATLQQVQNFSVALDGWLDVWGLLWGVPRLPDEANSIYSTRISRTVLAWVGTVPAIQAWINFYASGGSIRENLPNSGYVLTLPPTLSTAQVLAFLQSLSRIRPAGVPFNVNQVGGGLFLGTVEYLSQGTVQGAYLTDGSSSTESIVGAVTPNSVPLLPTLYFSDFYLAQPGLAALISSIAATTTATAQSNTTEVTNQGQLVALANQLPTTDPGVAGQLWNNSGLVSVSQG